MIKQAFIFLALILLPSVVSAQEKEDVSKMFRDVVTVEVERAKYAPAIPPPPKEEVKGKKGKKHHEVPVEEPAADTLGPTMPAPSSELTKRAQSWYTQKAVKYTKANGANSGKNVTCNVTFPFKQKMLNPENAVDGKITMDVLIEAKEGKYRYTIKNIRHIASKPDMSGGDVYAKVPEAGSMSITDLTWKHIRSEAFADAKVVIDDIKAKMTNEVQNDKDEW
ncbi:MAG: hypothetical protein H0W61_15435 [Bacteroidetes bacterium]|nr:hypothetical protein [Bacteroidota bacterium]